VATPGDILTATEAEALLGQMGGDEGESSGALQKIAQNITNSTLPGVNKKQQKVSATLQTTEKGRLRNKMDIIVESWFRLKKKYEPDEKGKTAVSKVTDDAKDVSKQLSEDGKKQGKGLLGWLTGLLGMLGLGKTGMGRTLLKVIGNWLWKSIKFVGGKVWSFIKWGIGKAWGILKGIFRGVWNAIKGLGRGAWNMLKGAISGIGKFFSKLWTGFRNLPVWKAFGSAISGGVNAVKGVFTSAKNMITGALTNVGNFFKGALQKIPGIGKLFPSLAKAAAPGAAAAASAGSQAARQAASKPKGFFGKMKALGGKALGGIKDFGGKVISGGGQLLKKGVEGAKFIGGKAAAGIKYVGKLAGAPLRAAWDGIRKWMKGPGKKLLGQVLRRVPIVGSVIEGAFAAFDINKYAKDPKGSMEDLEQQVGKRVVEGLGGVAAGTALAAALGSVTGGLGTFLGFIAGDFVGRKVAGFLADQFDMTGLGRFVLGAFPSLTEKKIAALQAGDTEALKQKELQDFIIQRGVITPFSSKDEVLGMKKGGAISQLLGESGGTSSKLASLQIAAIETSNKYLYQLVELTKILVKKPAGGGGTPALPNVPIPQSNELQGDLSGPTYQDSRSSYFNSPYSMHTPGMVT